MSVDHSIAAALACVTVGDGQDRPSEHTDTPPHKRLRVVATEPQASLFVIVGPCGSPTSIALSSDKKVQCAGGPVHGWWQSIRDDLRIKFDPSEGDESKAQLQHYKRIEGTHAWQLYWRGRCAVPHDALVLLLSVTP